MKFKEDCFYSFVREKPKWLPQILEFREGTFSWISQQNVYDDAGFYSGKAIPKTIGVYLKQAILDGYKVSVCEFAADYATNLKSVPKVFELTPNDKGPTDARTE